MDIGTRIKSVRTAKKQTQQEFADVLGLKRNTIATYEIGRAMPSDRTITDICSRFGVNESWLRTGDGDMLVKRTRTEQLAEFFGRVNAGDEPVKEKLINVLLEADESTLLVIAEFAKKLVKEFENE